MQSQLMPYFATFIPSADLCRFRCTGRACQSDVEQLSLVFSRRLRIHFPAHPEAEITANNQAFFLFLRLSRERQERRVQEAKYICEMREREEIRKAEEKIKDDDYLASLQDEERAAVLAERERKIEAERLKMRHVKRLSMIANKLPGRRPERRNTTHELSSAGANSRFQSLMKSHRSSIRKVEIDHRS